MRNRGTDETRAAGPRPQSAMVMLLEVAGWAVVSWYVGCAVYDGLEERARQAALPARTQRVPGATGEAQVCLAVGRRAWARVTQENPLLLLGVFLSWALYARGVRLAGAAAPGSAENKGA